MHLVWMLVFLNYSVTKKLQAKPKFTNISPVRVVTRPDFPESMATTRRALNQPIVFIIGGDVIPAQRPRVENGKARYPEDYEQWRKSALQALKASIAGLPAMVTQHFPLTKVRVAIEFHGCARENSDLDNLFKGVQDAMVKAGIITGDSVRKVNEISGKYFERDCAVFAIIVYPNWNPVSAVDPALLTRPNIPKTVRAAKRKTAATRAATTDSKPPKLTIVKTPKK